MASGNGRVLVLWCPDWPVAAGLREVTGRSAEPAAVFRANRVVTCNAAARAEGIRIGMRRRDAQSRWPQLQVLRADPDRDARLFEPIAAAVEEQIPGIEVLRPGLLVCSARAATRLLGSEEAVAERVTDLVESWDVEGSVGVADNLTVAVLAARHRTLVPTGGDAAFCAPLPIADLAREHTLAPAERGELVDLLIRLGITTIGAFAQLPEQKVVQRFGADGLVAHRLARGRAERGLFRRQVPDDLGVERICDPPLDRVDTAAFAARSLAADFHDRLAAAGMACTRLMVSAVTDRGKEFSRVWRAARPLTADATADRVRWQLDGWLTEGRTRRPGRQQGQEQLDGFEPGPDEDQGPGAITLLRLDPVEVIGAGRVQFGLWGSEGQDDHRAGWAFSRVQGLLGPEAVLSPVRSGGRGPAERITLVPWGEEKVPDRDPDAPWPGMLPAPSPSRISPSSIPGGADLDLVDADGDAVRLTDRGLLTGEPVAVILLPAGPGSPAEGAAVSVVAWAGPWLLDEQWWRTREVVEQPTAGRTVGSAREHFGWTHRAGRARRPIASQDADDRREASVAAHAGVEKDPAAMLSRVLTAPPRRAARLQVVTPEGDGLLLCLTPTGWELEGVYD